MQKGSSLITCIVSSDFGKALGIEALLKTFLLITPKLLILARFTGEARDDALEPAT